MKMMVLETSVEGAFAEHSMAKTAYAGVSSYGWLNNTWSYNALGSFGSMISRSTVLVFFGT